MCYTTTRVQTEGQNDFLAQAFQEHRERLLRLAERHLNPILRRRVSPEDVLQEAAAGAYRWGGDFIHNPDLPVYFRLRAILLQAITHLERHHLQSAKRDAYREAEPPPVDDGEEAVPPWDGIPDTATSPLSAAARADRHAILRQALPLLNIQCEDGNPDILKNYSDYSSFSEEYDELDDASLALDEEESGDEN